MRLKTTSFVYDPMGQLKATTNPLGDDHFYSYDHLVRVRWEDHNDKGVTSYRYDNAGNLFSLNYIRQ